MVIDDFDIFRLDCPAEANAVLVVDANGMLTGAVAAKCFQSIAGWNSQRVERYGGGEHRQFSQGGALQAVWDEGS